MSGDKLYTADTIRQQLQEQYPLEVFALCKRRLDGGWDKFPVKVIDPENPFTIFPKDNEGWEFVPQNIKDLEHEYNRDKHDPESWFFKTIHDRYGVKEFTNSLGQVLKPNASYIYFHMGFYEDPSEKPRDIPSSWDYIKCRDGVIRSIPGDEFKSCVERCFWVEGKKDCFGDIMEKPDFLPIEESYMSVIVHDCMVECAPKAHGVDVGLCLWPGFSFLPNMSRIKVIRAYLDSHDMPMFNFEIRPSTSPFMTGRWEIFQLPGFRKRNERQRLHQKKPSRKGKCLSEESKYGFHLLLKDRDSHLYPEFWIDKNLIQKNFYAWRNCRRNVMFRLKITEDEHGWLITRVDDTGAR